MRQRLATASLLLLLVGTVPAAVVPRIPWDGTGGKTPSVLQEAQVEIIPYSECNSSDVYGGMINNNMICAGSLAGGTDTCQGDSGGPLACYHPSDNKFYLLGVTSFGFGCGRQRYPGVYVRVPHYRRWINSQLLLNGKAVNPVSITLMIFLTVRCILFV